MKTGAFALLLTTFCLACAVPPPVTAPQPGSDDFAIQTTVLAMYNVVSGPAGRHDWDRFQELFAPGARLIAAHASNGTTTVQTPAEYAKTTQVDLAEHALFEHPIATRIEHAGDIAHVFSTYEARHASGDAQPFARGVNSIQLVRSGDRWLIATVLTQEEDAAHPLPAAFLPKQ